MGASVSRWEGAVRGVAVQGPNPCQMDGRIWEGSQAQKSIQPTPPTKTQRADSHLKGRRAGHRLTPEAPKGPSTQQRPNWNCPAGLHTLTTSLGVCGFGTFPSGGGRALQLISSTPLVEMSLNQPEAKPPPPLPRIFCAAGPRRPG